MAIPGVNDLMLPVLELLADGKEHSIDEAVAVAQTHFNLSPEDIRLKLDNGNYKINNQIDWVRSHFTRTGIAENLGDGWFQILPCGQYVLAHHSAELSVKFLNDFMCEE